MDLITVNELIGIIDFNNRDTLLRLIEYTRNIGPGYGITSILENFLTDYTKDDE